MQQFHLMTGIVLLLGYFWFLEPPNTKSTVNSFITRLSLPINANLIILLLSQSFCEKNKQTNFKALTILRKTQYGIDIFLEILHWAYCDHSRAARMKSMEFHCFNSVLMYCFRIKKKKKATLIYKCSPYKNTKIYIYQINLLEN